MPELKVGDYHWVYHFDNSEWEIAVIRDRVLYDEKISLYFQFYDGSIKECDLVNYHIKPIKKYKG